MSSQDVVAQAVNDVKKRADALFYRQQYSEALILYEDIFEQERKASESMLLKMAYTAERLQDYPRAIYYLYCYQQRAPNRDNLLYIEELANKYALEGHDLTDSTYFYLIYQQYYTILVGIFTLICLLLFYTFVIKNWQQRLPTRYGIVIVLVILIGYVLFNIIKLPQKAIIVEDYTLLMQDASSGAPIIEVLSKGHGLEVSGQQDVWLEVSRGAQKAYVKRSKVYLLKPIF
ncbi:MAG: hypothetical protein AAF734_00575 [Bacteroidota bacterium]